MNYKNLKNIRNILLCISAFVSGGLNALDASHMGSDYEEWERNIRNLVRDDTTVSQDWRNYIAGFASCNEKIKKLANYSLTLIRKLDQDYVIFAESNMELRDKLEKCKKTIGAV